MRLFPLLLPKTFKFAGLGTRNALKAGKQPSQGPKGKDSIRLDSDVARLRQTRMQLSTCHCATNVGPGQDPGRRGCDRGCRAAARAVAALY